MLDYKLGFHGAYIAAVELGDTTPTYTIARVGIEKVESMKIGDDDGKGKEKDRLIVFFREIPRGWLLNRTNAECLVDLWGRDAEQWVGHKVTLFSTPVRVGPKMEPGIRIKGSPELTSERVVSVKLPRKKPQPMKLIPTGNTRTQDSGPRTEKPSKALTKDELLTRLRGREWVVDAEEHMLKKHADWSDDDVAAVTAWATARVHAAEGK